MINGLLIIAAFIGPYDLSASLVRMGQVDHPEVQAAIGRVRQVCLERGMPLGIFSGTTQRARVYVQEGYTLIAAGGDNLMLIEAAREIVNRLRE
jgi:2-keto-3-deoxy-L-rhamnonate aldolase RhmA